ncbi:MAG TPA: GNAT family N-acetyltransferase [Pseudomonadales bacterium]|jgi:predicted acetyltransferase|nr:GNAT family N-acetyltransferase [Pseudomonadales bacterium]|tara:strand:- start:2683 stop:3897 length:1215 start_codon:yes stop_codon:yes gene_type:complete
MNVEIRPLTAGEMGQLGELGGYVYGGSFGDGPDNVVATANLPDWTLCALVDGKLVSSFTAIPFTMRANGNAVALAGVSTVGTQPEYRRQGLLRRIQTQAFADMRDRGQSVAALWASQAAIYQRYGYAMTTVLRSYHVDTTDIGFHDGVWGSGCVERLSVNDAFDVIKSIYIRFVENRTCYLHRSKALWLQNAMEEIEGQGPIHAGVHYDEEGKADGYIIYTLRANKVDHATRGQEIIIRDMAWLSMDGYRSMWEWLKRHDLVGRVSYQTAAADDPAVELFAEPRLLHGVDHEGIWLRVVDATGALGDRAYSSEGEITIGLTDDPLTPWNNRSIRLEASPEGAHVTSSKSADLQTSAKALASLYSGFRTARQLRAWGLIEGEDHVIDTADRLFASSHAPHCPDHF